MRTNLLLILCLATAAACGGGDDDGGGGSGDASPAGDDAGAADAIGGGGDGLLLAYREGTAQLALAYMGYVLSGDTIDQLYFEISNMDEPGCPDKTSPIPPQLLTMSGFSGGEPGTRTHDDGVRVNFFDFDGTLRKEIEPASATDATLTVTELDVETGVAHVTATITFGADGTATGSFIATHCDSLDTAD